MKRPELKNAIGAVLSQEAETPKQMTIPVPLPPQKTKQYNIVMPEWQWKQLKQLSLDSDKSIKDLINEGLCLQYNLKMPS